MSLNPAIVTTFSSRRRNFMLSSHRRDALIEWIKDMLYHSYVLDASHTYFDSMSYFEELVNEHIENPSASRLRLFVPSVGKFHTKLPLRDAFIVYDAKYNVTKRRHVGPTFNEIRHTLNLAQVMAIGKDIKLITFDGDQTLYSDGANFEDDEELSGSILRLLQSDVRVCVVTAAGYGLDGSKYEFRLQGLLDAFLTVGLSASEVSNFYVCGGECNYLLQCHLRDRNGALAARLLPVDYDVWQAEIIGGPRPAFWPTEKVVQILDIAEGVMRQTISDLKLRAKLLRKDRAVGIYPGGEEMLNSVPVGHGSKKLKREALEETVLRVLEALRVAQPPIELPFCVFNGGQDAWLDIGSKSVGVAQLQAFFRILPSECLHVGDQEMISQREIHVPVYGSLLRRKPPKYYNDLFRVGSIARRP